MNPNIDMVFNGAAHGSLAERLMNNNMNHHVLRPYNIDGRGTYITVNKGTEDKPKWEPELISNAVATLRKDDWIALDRAVVEVAQPRMTLVSAFSSRGLTYGISGGMGKTILQTETQSDISEADISMDGLKSSTRDRPVFELKNLPLPIISKNFHYSAREIMASRQGGSPLDVTTAKLASMKVTQLTEKLHAGTYGSYEFGGGTIYGLTNFPQRNTHTLTAPTASGWTGKTIVDQVIAMRQKAMDDFHYGPYILFNAPGWDTYLDQDYSTAKGDNTVRERIRKIRGIEDVITVDYLTGYAMVLVQLTEDVFRTVNALPLTTVQWDTEGGLLMNFKVMSISVPQPRADQNNNSGIVHGAPA